MKRQKIFNKLWVLVLLAPLLLLAACSDDNGTDDTTDSEAGAATEATEIETAEINPITEEEIRAAQVAWGEGLVSISTAFAEDGDYVTIAAGVLDDLYGYDYHDVLFKPTLTNDVPFRTNWHAAASYFIGTSAPEVIAEDGSGFATNPWAAVSFEDDWTYIIHGENAIGMGTVVITDVDGGLTTVHKSMGWFRDTDGNLRLKLHHSSVPFSAE